MPILSGTEAIPDDSNSGACSPDIECFVQILALHDTELSTVNLLLSENTATEHGPDIFGGLLDRCIPSQFAEVYLKHSTVYDALTYLNINTTAGSITSQPV